MFSFQENNAMFSVTPVQNMFIEEVLPHLTGDAVKVYLYGLKCCYYPPRNASMEAFAQTLGMEQSEVLQCLHLLEKNGVIRKISDTPPQYIYFNQIYNAFTQSGTPEASLIRSNQAFINRVNVLFEGRQILHEMEYTILYDWIDTMGFSQDAVLIFLQVMLKKAGPKKRLNFSRLDKEITLWHKEGALTLESAQNYAKSLSQRFQGAERVLRIFNIRRVPDYGEEMLYEKWLKWGFDQEAIDSAAKSIDSAMSPNLKYLDRVLQDYMQQGVFRASDIKKLNVRKEESRNLTSEILRIFGSVNRVSDEMSNLYQKWRSMGFSHPFLCKSARHLILRGQSTMQEMDLFLEHLKQMNLLDEKQLDAFLQDEKSTYALMQAMGVFKRPTQDEIRFYRKMRDRGLSDAQLLALAQRSRGVAVPQTYFMRLAQQEGGVPAVSLPESRTKQVSGQNYEMQRSYSEEEMDRFIDDLMDWDTEKDKKS